MHLPAHLARSRHGIYYLRWPLPRTLHPKQKRTDLKVSLRTRDRREALRLARHLGYVADRVASGAVDAQMRYDEMRAMVRQHFKSLLDNRKESVNAHGRLSELDLSALENSLLATELPFTDDAIFGEGWYEAALQRFQGLYGLSLHEGTKEHQQLTEEF